MVAAVLVLLMIMLTVRLFPSHHTASCIQIVHLTLGIGAEAMEKRLRKEAVMAMVEEAEAVNKGDERLRGVHCLRCFRTAQCCCRCGDLCHDAEQFDTYGTSSSR